MGLGNALTRTNLLTAAPTIDAQVGYNCLASVPLNASAATELVESILPYLEWQTGIFLFSTLQSTCINIT